MKRGAICLLILLMALGFSEKITNFTGDEIFPVQREHLYFIRYNKSSSSIVKRSPAGETTSIIEDFLLPVGLDVSPDESLLLWISNMEDSRGVLKLRNIRKEKDQILDSGKRFDGAVFITNDKIVYSADNWIWLMDIPSGNKKKLGRGITPSYSNLKIYYARGKKIIVYDIRDETDRIFFENTGEVFYPVEIAEYIYFIERGSNMAFVILGGSKLPFFKKASQVVTLHGGNDKLFFSRKDENHDIEAMDLWGDVPFFSDKKELFAYPYKDLEEENLAYERYLSRNSNDAAIIKRAFLSGIRLKLRQRSGEHLASLKNMMSEEEYSYYNILHRYIFKEITAEEMENAVSGKYGERIDIIRANYFFHLKNYDKALEILKGMDRDSSFSFSAGFNMASIYSKFGDLWEITNLWQEFSGSVPAASMERFSKLLEKAFSSELLTFWERIYFLDRFGNSDEDRALKASILSKLKLYDAALDLLKDNTSTDAELIRLRIGVERHDLDAIARIIYPEARRSGIWKSEVMSLLDLDKIFNEKDRKTLEFLYRYFPTDLSVAFWYLLYVRENHPLEMKVMYKALSKNDPVYHFKKYLLAFFLEKDLATAVNRRFAAGKWEDPALFLTMGVEEFQRRNYNKARGLLLKAFTISTNENYHLNSLILSYLSSTFHMLDDYDNLYYYLDKKLNSYPFTLNKKKWLDDQLLFSRVLQVRGEGDKAIERLDALRDKELDLEQRIKLLSYITFLKFINRDFNSALLSTLRLLGEKEKVPQANFTLEFKLLGNIYYELDDLKNAEIYYLKALEEIADFKVGKKGLFNFQATVSLEDKGSGLISKKLKDNLKKEIFNKLISIYGRFNDYENADKYLNERIGLLSKKEKKQSEMAMVYNHFGMNRLKEENYSRAFWNFKQSYLMLKNLEVTIGLGENLIDIYSSNFPIADFDPQIPHKDFLKIVDDPKLDNDKKAILLFLRIFPIIEGLKTFKFDEMEKMLLDYEKKFTPLIQVQKRMQKVKDKLTARELKALMELGDHFASLALGISDMAPIDRGIALLSENPLNGMIWYFFFIKGEMDKAVEAIQQTLVPIPPSLMPVAVALMKNAAQTMYEKDDLINTIKYLELSSTLRFFIYSVGREWDFSSELDNIYYRNIVYLKNKLLFKGITNRDLNALREEMFSNTDSLVNFFMTPYTYDVKMMLEAFQENTIFFEDLESDIQIIYDHGKLIKGGKGEHPIDYNISYTQNYENKIANSSTLNWLFLSNDRFNYNPEMILDLNEKTKEISGFGILNSGIIKKDQGGSWYLNNMKLSGLIKKIQAPYHLFISEIQDHDAVEIIQPLLLFSGITSFSLGKPAQLPESHFRERNRYNASGEICQQQKYFGYRGIDKDGIETHIGSKINILLNLAIDSYKKKKWALSSIYFQNLINIYGSPLESDQKTKIFTYFINSLFYSGQFDLGIHYLNKVIDDCEKDHSDSKEVLYRFLKNLLTFYNSKKDLSGAMKTAKKMQEAFDDNNLYLFPILLTQLNLLQSNGMHGKALQLSERLYSLMNASPNGAGSFGSIIILNRARLMQAFGKDPEQVAALFNKGFEFDILSNKGKNIDRFFFDYLRSLIRIKQWDLDKAISTYSNYLSDLSLFAPLKGAAKLKSGDLGGAMDIARKLIAAKDTDKTSGYNLQGLVYFELEEVQLAGKSFTKALEYSIKTKNTDDISNITSNLAIIDIARGDLEKARSKINEILSLDRKGNKVYDILYDLRLLTVLLVRMGVQPKQEIKEIMQLATEHNYSEYSFFARMWKIITSTSDAGPLKELLNSNPPELIRAELLYRLSRSEPAYAKDLISLIPALEGLSSFELIKNGMSFDPVSAFVDFFRSNRPEISLHFFYKYLLSTEERERTVFSRKADELIPGRYLILLGNVLFIIENKNGALQQYEKVFDRLEFNRNFSALYRKVKAFSAIELEVDYFRELFSPQGRESKPFNDSLIPTGNIFLLPLNIIYPDRVKLYSMPYKRKNSAESRQAVFASENKAHFSHLRRSIESDMFFALYPLEINYVDPYLSRTGEGRKDLSDCRNYDLVTFNAGTPFPKAFRGEDLLVANNNTLLILSPRDDDAYFSVFIRKFLECKDFDRTSKWMKERFKFPRYYALFNFINTALEK